MMSSVSIRANRSILADLEWDDGLSLPVANADNKLLEGKVQQKQQLIIQKKNELKEIEDRSFSMTEHLKNIHQELSHCQGLTEARRKEFETEEHMLKLAEREDGRLHQEIKRIMKQMDELNEKINIYENNIFKKNQKLDDMKSQMNWGQQTLEAWLEESTHKQEHSMAIEKYTRQDESKIKELNLRMEKLTEEVRVKRRALDTEMMATLTAQIELDKTAEGFRHAHSDRQELIAQWENIIDQMQRRDKEIDLLAVQLGRVKMEARKKEESIHERLQFLDNEVDNNQEQEKKISIAERLSGKMRCDVQENETQRFQFSDELDALKRTVDRTSLDLEIARSTVSQLKKEVVDKANKLQQAKDLREALTAKLKMATEATLTVEEKAANMHDLLTTEDQTQHALERDLKNMRDILFRKQEDLNKACRCQRELEALIQGSHAAVRNLNSKVVSLDHDSLKQQEIIYNQDFNIQQLERRISRMQGESSNEEKIQLEQRLQELSDDLESKNSTHTLLTAQLKRLQDDVRRVNRDRERSCSEKAEFTGKIEETTLYNDNSERELRTLTKNKQALMVDENLMKLEVKRLRDNLTTRSGDVLTHEKRKLQLETSIKERIYEIGIHKEMLNGQVRSAEEERQHISAQLHERSSKIDKLRKRYEIFVVAMAPLEGEEERSQAYYVIKAAQEREELQRDGDCLDARICKAEKEIRALENTLHVVGSRNELYRKSFSKITESSDEAEERDQLEEQMRAVMDKYKYKRRQNRELSEDLQTMQTTLDQLSRDEAAYIAMIDDRKDKFKQLNKELEEQQTKLERVAKQNAKYSHELRKLKKTKGDTPEERDFQLRETRDFNKSVMRMIYEAVSSHPEMMDTVVMYFAQANLPAMTSAATPGSARSSLSSVSSSPVSSVRSYDSAKVAITPVQIGTEGNAIADNLGDMSAKEVVYAMQHPAAAFHLGRQIPPISKQDLYSYCLRQTKMIEMTFEVD